jgi:uncharacterized phage protein (TIGR01671 family)
MREIKFRAWNDKYKEMLYLESKTDEYYNGAFLLWGERDGNFWRLGDANHEWEEGASNTNDGTDSKDVLMQYTGLKDKNGKEIYEGDILNMTHHGSVSIVKPEIKGVVGFENAAFIVGEDRVPLGRIGRSLEVIGNIYENPELLESEE